MRICNWRATPTPHVVVKEARNISTPTVVSLYARAAIPARYAVERESMDGGRRAAPIRPTASFPIPRR